MRTPSTLACFVVALAACTKPQEPAPAPAPPQPALEVDKFRELDETQRPRRTSGGAPRADAKALSDRWLIILDSEGDMEKRAGRLSKLATLDVKSAPATLSSTEFKGLMPCFDVLIASHFADRKEAIAYSKTLTAAGVGNYPKNAGKYVGKQPAVEAYCAAGRSESSCGEDLYLAVAHNGRTFVHLGLGDVGEARALEKAPTPVAIDGAGVWAQPLTAVKLGALKTGSKVTVVDDAAQTWLCAVKGFVALTRGTPHFSALESGEPACGEPAVFAEVDCDVRGATLAWSSGANVQVGKRLNLNDQRSPLPIAAALTASGAAARRAGEAHAREQGVNLDERSWDLRWSLGDKTYRHGHVTLTTGEGFSECGGPDFKATLDGWSVDDAVVSPLREGYARKTRALIALGGTPLEFYTEHFGDRVVRAVAGGERCRLPMPFCDCGC